MDPGLQPVPLRRMVLLRATYLSTFVIGLLLFWDGVRSAHRDSVGCLYILLMLKWHIPRSQKPGAMLKPYAKNRVFGIHAVRNNARPSRNTGWSLPPLLISGEPEFGYDKLATPPSS